MESKFFNSISVLLSSSLLILSGIGIYHLISHLQTRAYVQIEESGGVEEILLSGWGLLVPIGIFLGIGLIIGALMALGSSESARGEDSESGEGRESAEIYAYAIANAMADVSEHTRQSYRPGDALLHMEWLQQRLVAGDSREKITKDLSDRIKETYLGPATSGNHRGVV